MIAVDKPMNWQDNKDYCKRFESNLIFLSGQEKSKFLRNKMALILEKNHYRSLTGDQRGGLSLGPNHTSNGLIFIGKSIPIEPWTRLWSPELDRMFAILDGRYSTKTRKWYDNNNAELLYTPWLGIFGCRS